MGWTFTRKPPDVMAYMNANHTWDDDKASRKVLRSALVGFTYYAAVEYVDKATGARSVWAGVSLIRYAPKDPDGYTFGVKDMGEDMGPNEAKCPQTILALLTPTDHTFAQEWRKRCGAYHVARKAPVTDAEVSAWASSHGAHFAGMSDTYRRKWRNAYRKRRAEAATVTA